MSSNRLRKKIVKKGTENVKHSGQRLKVMRAMFFEMENNRNDWIAKEWQTTKRAMSAEREVKRLTKLLVDNGISTEVE